MIELFLDRRRYIEHRSLNGGAGMKSASKLVSVAVAFAAVVLSEISFVLPALADSEASTSAGSEAGTESGGTGGGRRRGGRRAAWRKQMQQANKQNQKEQQQERSKQWTGDHR
jgi:hypothetical protein